MEELGEDSMKSEGNARNEEVLEVTMKEVTDTFQLVIKESGDSLQDSLRQDY
jgi:hypothetical protein